MVEEVALSCQQRTLVAEIRLLQERKNDVGAKDRGLFLKQNIPRAKEGVDRMQQWVRSVRNSIRRRAAAEKRTNRKIGEYFRVTTRGKNQST